MTEPISYFNRWFATHVEVQDNSVAGVLQALNRHPVAQDATAQDYVMPMGRVSEKPGRFRVFGENQDVFYCFVRSGTEVLPNPPVYFETCLDLERDYDVPSTEILDDDVVQVADGFNSFLWHMLGHQICLRLDHASYFAPGVNGVAWDGRVELDDSFANRCGREFPTRYTCFFTDDTICIRDWGAAFIDRRASDAFLARFAPKVNRCWGA